ncbi:MAG: nucleoside kinase [Eubacterium sp.]
MIRVNVDGKDCKYEDGTTLYEIAKDYRDNYEHNIILAMCNGVLCELSKVLTENSKIHFITTASHIGNECYKRSVTFVMLKAFYKVAGMKNVEKISVHHSVSKGYYCQAYGNVNVDKKFVEDVKTEMERLCKRDILIMKETMPTAKAIKKFQKYGMKDKVHLLKYRRSSTVNVYRMEGFEDYFYGYMAYSTGSLKYFDLIPYEEGFVLQMPVKENPEEVPEFNPKKKVFDVLKEATDWAEMLGVPTIGHVNDKITDGTITDIMMVQEALQEKKIADIASEIAFRKDVKIIMIAGPSSSGKTSFSHRLSIQLMAQGLKPHPIPVDNYFVNREINPVDEEGKLDFEVIEAVDVKFFNEQMTELLKGERVELPEFNFVLGKREFHGNYLQLGEDDVLVIEGIHCLNDKMSYSLPADKKFKIYVSALTPLNVDEHNRIATSDLRLLRRIVRDVRTRGTSAENTIEMWKRVRRGEENNIFPYQDSADAVFNSAMVYELSVLKTYAEPALFSVSEGTAEYLEAKRLLKFLDYVLGLPKDNVPKNSLLSEFIGGSAFPV